MCYSKLELSSVFLCIDWSRILDRYIWKKINQFWITILCYRNFILLTSLWTNCNWQFDDNFQIDHQDWMHMFDVCVLVCDKLSKSTKSNDEIQPSKKKAVNTTTSRPWIMIIACLLTIDWFWSYYGQHHDCCRF